MDETSLDSAIHPISLEGSASSSATQLNNSGENDSELALRKRDYVLTELADSEETYVKDLAQITEGYLACMRNPNFATPLPEDLKGTKQKMVFGNIEQIYEWHRE